MRTLYDGSVGASYQSLPWGDGYTATVNNSYAGLDNLDFAGLERDVQSTTNPEEDTEHAQFRNYAPAQGRWLSPDRYLGSYDLTNPQSFNRYAYVLNNPTSSVDPLGLYGHPCEDGECDPPTDPCPWCSEGGGGAGAGGSNYGGPYVFKKTVYDFWLAQFELQYYDLVSSLEPGGGQSTAPNNVVKNLQCAAKSGQAHSIGALFGGGTIANFLGGNSVSGLVNLGLSVTGQQPFTSAPNLTGLGLGLPVNDILRLSGGQSNPLYGSASGTIRSTTVQGIFNAATESGAISSIAAEGGELAVQGGLTAGEFASGVGIAKFGLDLGTFLVGYYSCATQ
jgi:RHS repeat-associated protein